MWTLELAHWVWKVELASKIAATSINVDPDDAGSSACLDGAIWNLVGTGKKVQALDSGRKTPRPVPDASVQMLIESARGRLSARQFEYSPAWRYCVVFVVHLYCKDARFYSLNFVFMVSFHATAVV